MLYTSELAEIFEIPVEKLNQTLDFKNLESWDSLTLLSLVSYIKDNFGVVISNKEINEITELGQLQELIDSKS